MIQMLDYLKEFRWQSGGEPDVFVSIHINSASAGANGVEVWYPNSSYNANIHAQGKDLANEILKELVGLGLTNRGIKIRNSENGTKYPDGSLADYYSVIKDSKTNGFPVLLLNMLLFLIRVMPQN